MKYLPATQKSTLNCPSDCVECMACSDNVVRAGLTAKRVDAAALAGMLDYSGHATGQLLFPAQLEDAHCCVWRPPVPDFALAKIRVNNYL